MPLGNVAKIEMILWLIVAAGIAIGALLGLTAEASYVNNFEETFSRPNWAAKFRDEGLKTGTDKVTTHHYEFIYGKYFAHDTLHLHGRPMRLLEIGLGCNMVYGAGKSVQLWKAWFKNLDLHEMEYDSACVEKWKSELDSMENVTIHVGDQSSPKALNSLLEKAKVKPGVQPWMMGENQFDAIIDDGGHFFDQIVTSYNILFEKALKPGGVYIIEDIGPIRKPYPGRAYLDGQVINWIQGMVATVLGNAGGEPPGSFNTDPMNMHAPQARWVGHIEVQKNSVAIVKATEHMCVMEQSYCPPASA